MNCLKNMELWGDNSTEFQSKVVKIKSYSDSSVDCPSYVRSYNFITCPCMITKQQSEKNSSVNGEWENSCMKCNSEIEL